MFADDGRPIWSVSELTLAIKDQLENSFPSVSVEGEISNCRPSGAGHVYFTLKDSGAVISAALFRGKAARVEQQPADGMQAIVTGKIDVYPPRGSYQLIVENVRAAGRGALLEALERRKKALAAEGLFSQERKKPLPPYPRRVAVITSPTGAAIRDILQVLSRRAAAPRITVLPTPVQGADAPLNIAIQLRRAAAYNLGDVVILARGGGSLEDLMAFNEEIVTRAVADCPLPVISGVGHEIDISLADLAADVRAATPSAAAELVSDRSEDLLLRARGFRREAAGTLAGRLDAARRSLRANNIDELLRLISGRLEEALRGSDDARRELGLVAGIRLGDLRRRLDLALRSLEETSPLAVMERGYARVSMDGINVIDSGQLSVNDEITMEFARGGADARIIGIKAKKGK
jgi:exodeoxyribonuclease VII large subunit